jgi:UDP-N-acetylmuramoyl-tripeptide--D-alanyl-D-alanine ligase
VGIRTAFWWLHCWQLREYRFDRLKAYFQTYDGKKNIYSGWFFDGLLPRPNLSGRIVLISIIWSVVSVGLFWIFSQSRFPFWLFFLVWERTLWLTISIAVFFSQFPVWIAKQRLYRQAKKIIDQSPVICIGITGSYGKSSTKQILLHLLQSQFGKENVLHNPENQNNEVAIARLIKKNFSFFTHSQKKEKNRKFFICEIGAYRRGEIKKVCSFIQPHISILTGINAQHISLFGSQKNIQRGKFELAENTSEKVFFNADNQLLAQIFSDRDIQAVKIPLSLNSVKHIQSKVDRTNFEIYGKRTHIPWGGSFFVGNAILAAEVARELGISPKSIAQFLPKLPPLKRALSTQKMSSGASLILDLYSANPDGVLGAIEHLAKNKGKRIFVSIPLRELGKESTPIHREIFEKLRDIRAEIFWLRDDFSDMGKKICGKKFHGSDIQILRKMIQTLRSGDGVLLESRLPFFIVRLFS